MDISSLSFKMIHLSLVDGCNLRCLACARPDGYRYVDLDNLSRAIDNINRHVAYTQFVRILGSGEAFLHKRIDEAVLRLKHLTIPRLLVEIWTNGTIIPEAKTRAILELGVLDHVVFSIDGYGEAGSYEYLRPPAKFNRVIENVRLFLGLRDETGARCNAYVSCIVPDAGTVAFPHVDDHVVQQRFLDLLPGLSGVMTRRFGSWNGSLAPDNPLIPPHEAGQIGPCLADSERELFIDTQGAVHPCCIDIDLRHNLGNAFHEPLLAIYQRYEQVFGELRAGRLPDGCRDCNECRIPAKGETVR